MITLLTSPLPGIAQSQKPCGSTPLPQEKEEKKATQKSDDLAWPRTPEMMEREMRYRAEVAYRQAEQRKAVQAAKEIITLACRLKESTHPMNVQDTLKSIEKLAKRIRAFAGGKKSGRRPDHRPSTIAGGADQIMQLAQALKQQLESLDRRVISVDIIANANTIIQLTDQLRGRVGSDGM